MVPRHLLGNSPSNEQLLASLITQVRALGGRIGYTAEKDEDHDDWSFVSLIVNPPVGKRWPDQGDFNSSLTVEWTSDDAQDAAAALRWLQVRIQKPLEEVR